MEKKENNKLSINLNKILNINILEEWPLSKRSYNALKDNGIITVEDLIECNEGRLLTFRNFGRKGIEEVKNILDTLGLKLGMNLIYDDCLKEKLSKNKSNNLNKDIIQNNIKKNIPDEVLTIDIQREWLLSVRTYNVLKNEEIIYLGDLLSFDLNSLLKVRNFGKKSLKEIEGYLSKLDLDKYILNLSNWDNIKQNHIYRRRLSKIEREHEGNKNYLIQTQLLGRIKKSIFKDFQSFKEEYLKLEKIKINKNLSSIELEKLIIDDIEKIFLDINDKMNTLFRGRYAYLEDYKTLNTLGKKFGVTRERIRQNERDLNRSLSKLGKIDKNSLIEYFKKNEFISFHKLFPQLNKNFTNTVRGSENITSDALVIFMENYCGVEKGFFKTPERELWHFDKEKLKQIFEFTSSGVSRDNFIEIIKDNFGYDGFTCDSALDFMKEKNLIKIVDNKIYPKDLKKNSEVVNILLNYPNGLHWKKIAEIGSNSYTRNSWSTKRIMGDFSLNMTSNSKIYLCERGTYRLLRFCPEISNREKIIDFFINYLKNNNKVQMAMEIIFKDLIKERDFNNINFYDVRAIIKIFGKEKGIFHSGRSGTNTVSLDKNIKFISLKSKIKEIIDSSNVEFNRNDLIEKLQKTDEDLPIETHLSDLVDEMKIFRISPGTYLNLNDAIKLCDKDEVKIVLDRELNNYEFITSGFIREKINDELGFHLSNLYYDSLSRILAKENNWYHSSNYLSKKLEKKKSFENYIKENYNESLSKNENFDIISKKIGMTKVNFNNIVYYSDMVVNTDWVHQND
mgnify:CR=1 FL=1